MSTINEIKIKDMKTYLSHMKNGIEDKLFFINFKMDDIDTFVDFGCADGSLLKSLSLLFPKKRLIGYDISEEMLGIAKKNVSCCEFYSDWDKINVSFDKSCLILSSVIHEVYSYSSQGEIENFWRIVFQSGFKYIIIRDMMYSKEDVISLHDTKKIKANRVYRDKIESFEKINGPLSTSKQTLSFLLKYRYSENWDREVKENYLPLDITEFEHKISKDYDKIFFEHRTLPFLKKRIKEDFGVELKMKTHMKIILEKR